ncbi:MAG TPA: DNA internalization-related competence protein ComEC/Rec2 [Vicinamibacterales bacterium]|nr:DNA internalization-related competence protein ComEC/Rec2 [Vicinamibacterales bacterium]
MPSVGLLPGIALIAGAASAPVLVGSPIALVWLPAACWGLALIAWRRRAPALTSAALAFGFFACGAILAADATRHALSSTLRTTLDREVGGFALEELGPAGEHDPILARVVLTEDASPRDDFVSLRARVTAIRLRHGWHAVDGGVTISVGGAVPADRLRTWRARRVIEAPMTFRRPARYLNDGVADFERDLALDGVTLLATIKSGRLIEIIERGSWVDERAADVRAHVRRALGRWVEPHDALSAAIAAAVLIGDRTGLPDETRNVLQAAGTYHVIAISGGNIAILAGVAAGLFALCGIRGRRASVLAIAVLAAYALVVTAGPSVWRATLMAIVYFTARAIDHRTPVWQAAAVAAALIALVRPLDINDPGFILSFGATAALLEGARRGALLLPRSRVWSWVVASVTASLAVETALLPVSASAFSRVTSAGLVLNLLAVPAMGVVQVAALIVAAGDSLPMLASPAAWAVHAASVTLVASAQLVTKAPWLTARVPPPGAALVLTYYVALTVLVVARGRLRVAAGVVFACALVAIGGGVDLANLIHPPVTQRVFRLTVFDVGQGESMLLETPARRAILIDTGGALFGGGGLDIGQRVLAPALWARGVRSLDALLLTHGDPDHIGGAMAMLEDFAPLRLWEGVRVPHHPPSEALIASATRQGSGLDALRAGRDLSVDGVQVRVLHPPEPDWERRRVRNDDSVVVEVTYGDVAFLLTGDIGAEVEQSIVPLLTRARVRILKVAHHGSRTSTSQALLDAWRPQIAVISCGRGNRFGHPARDVVHRLETTGATVLRTDRDGQITIETDGTSLSTTTFTGGRQ